MIPTFKFCLRSDLTDTKFLPIQSEPTATGYDVRAAQYDKLPVTLRAGQYIKLPLGIRVFSPDDYWLELRPRSSTLAKKFLHCLYGVIDCGYENEILLAAQYIPDLSSLSKDLTIEYGEPIGQLVPVKRQVMTVENVDEEQFNMLCKNRAGSRGLKGFGETGG